MMKYKLLVLYISVTQFASGSENDSGEVFSQAKHHRHSKRGIYGHGMDRNEKGVQHFPKNRVPRRNR